MNEVPVGIEALGRRWTMAVHPDGDAHISAALRTSGVWEPFESAVVARLVSCVVADHPEALFVDCGANIGWYTLLAASLGATVVAAEPMPTNAALLRHNVSISGWTDSITVHECALGAVAGSAHLHLSASNQGDHRLHADEPWDASKRRATVEVDVRPLPQLLRDAGTSVPVGIIKLDTQGSETAILEGATSSWQPMEGRPHTSIVTEFWPYGLQRCGSSAAELLQLLTPLVGTTHRCFEIIEPSRRLVERSLDELRALPTLPGMSLEVRGFTNLALVPHGLAPVLYDLVTG